MSASTVLRETPGRGTDEISIDVLQQRVDEFRNKCLLLERSIPIFSHELRDLREANLQLKLARDHRDKLEKDRVQEMQAEILRLEEKLAQAALGDWESASKYLDRSGQNINRALAAENDSLKLQIQDLNIRFNGSEEKLKGCVSYMTEISAAKVRRTQNLQNTIDQVKRDYSQAEIGLERAIQEIAEETNPLELQLRKELNIGPIPHHEAPSPETGSASKRRRVDQTTKTTVSQPFQSAAGSSLSKTPLINTEGFQRQGITTSIARSESSIPLASFPTENPSRKPQSGLISSHLYPAKDELSLPTIVDARLRRLVPQQEAKIKDNDTILLEMLAELNDEPEASADTSELDEFMKLRAQRRMTEEAKQSIAHRVSGPSLGRTLNHWADFEHDDPTGDCEDLDEEEDL